MQQGVDQRGEGLRPRKQRRAFGEQRQHSGTQIPVEGKGHVRSTEGGLENTVGGRQRESMSLILNVYEISAQFDIKTKGVKKSGERKKPVSSLEATVTLRKVKGSAPLTLA